jgi:CheY-like chemotaxis protein
MKIQYLLDKGPKKILVVEDHPAVLHLYVRLLTQQGYEVTQAVDVSDALHKLDRGYHLILTDYDMPGADGLELAKIAKSLLHIPILLVTAVHVPETPNVDAVIFKPFEGKDLTDTIGYLLSA